MAETARKSGRLGSLWLTVADDTTVVIGDKIADIFNWTFEAQSEVEDVTTKGDLYARNQANGVSARFTGQAYVQTIAAMLSRISASATEDPGRFAFKLWLIDNTAGFQTIAGFCWLTRGSLNAPRGMSVDDCEFTVDGEFTMATT